MLSFEFAPAGADAKEIIKTFNQQKIDLVHDALQQVVYEEFSPSAKGYRVSVYTSAHDNLLQCIKITIEGVQPFPSSATQKYVQSITDRLRTTQLKQLFFIRHVTSEPKMGDTLLSPDDLKGKNQASILLALSGLREEDVPGRFKCPITGGIINSPAFLTSNPKIKYEYQALLKWIIEKHTDPTTRIRISAPGITVDDKLKKEIASFLMDAIFNRNLSKYEQSTCDVATMTDPERSWPIRSGNSSVSLWRTARETTFHKEASDSALTNIFKTYKVIEQVTAIQEKRFELSEQELSTAAVALRRAAFMGDNEAISELLKSYPASEIIDRQGDKSQKTALHVAIGNNQAATAELLLSHGAKADITDANSATARDMISTSTNSTINGLVDMLVQQVTETEPSPPLHAACL